jgi:hypothetical protein
MLSYSNQTQTIDTSLNNSFYDYFVLGNPRSAATLYEIEPEAARFHSCKSQGLLF